MSVAYERTLALLHHWAQQSDEGFELSKPWCNTNTRRTIVAVLYFASIQVQAGKEMKQPPIMFICNV